MSSAKISRKSNGGDKPIMTISIDILFFIAKRENYLYHCKYYCQNNIPCTFEFILRYRIGIYCPSLEKHSSYIILTIYFYYRNRINVSRYMYMYICVPKTNDISDIKRYGLLKKKK